MIGKVLDYMAEKNGGGRMERVPASAPDTTDRRPEAVRDEHARRCRLASDARNAAVEAAAVARMWLECGRGTETACAALDDAAAAAQTAYNAEMVACHEELT